MSAAIQHVLQSFDALPEPDKHEATVEILRRYSPAGDIPEESLVATADELFCSMDEDESLNAAS